MSRFNQALSEKLRACSTAEVEEIDALISLSTNRFGDASVKGMRSLKACKPDLFGQQEVGREVSRELWTVIAPEAQVPTTLEKAKAIVFRGAGELASDYDRAFWNADAPKAAGELVREVFSWGPAKATVVDGCFVQKIIRAAAARPGILQHIERVFAEERDGLAELLRGNCDQSGRAFLQIAANPVRKERFVRAFVRLGADADIRTAYDQTFISSSGPWFRRIDDYYRLFLQAGLNPTETDFAMFLELARGAPIPVRKIAERATQIRHAKPGSPAEARRAMFKTMKFTSEASRRFALGRLVSYYIDGIGLAELTPDELGAWRDHSRVRASDVGLTEQAYRPCNFMPELYVCSITQGQQQ